MTTFSRMQLLRGKHHVIRPPWTKPEAEFIENCSRCHACLEQCPEHIIIKGRGSFPEIDFSKGECTFCEHCAVACPTTAISKANTQIPWTLKIQINHTCLAQQNVVCITCGEFCNDSAIRFPPKLGGIAHPELNFEQCTGCGACFAVCPTQAIQLQYTQKS
ncbi:MAG: ferredoxin-type protein NapF [Thiotrichaceae bacterium]|nr:ferredoxin-type protein NapF [Thiotrichaceae bacterium]